MGLAACLIVKDASATLRRALTALAPAVDEIVVYDTGSSDGSRELALSFGATLVDGYWDDDFARARNDAMAHVRSDWVLSVDADEYATVDVPALRALLTSPSPVRYSVEIINAAPAGAYAFRTVRLVRRDGARWVGAVHEDLTVSGDAPLVAIPADVLRFDHDGYADETLARTKALRNAQIGMAEVEALRSDPAADPARLRRALLDLGRSLVAAGRSDLSVAAFDAVRLMGTADDLWARATDHLTRVRLESGAFADALSLVREMRRSGVDRQYCDWLEAQALAQTGSPARAVELLSSITVLDDPSGHRYDLGRVVEFRALAHVLAGDVDAAVDAMLTAMTQYGRLGDRAALVRSWWTPRPVSDLVDAARRSGGPFVAEAVAALAA